MGQMRPVLVSVEMNHVAAYLRYSFTLPLPLLFSYGHPYLRPLYLLVNPVKLLAGSSVLPLLI